MQFKEGKFFIFYRNTKLEITIEYTIDDEIEPLIWLKLNEYDFIPDLFVLRQIGDDVFTLTANKYGEKCIENNVDVKKLFRGLLFEQAIINNDIDFVRFHCMLKIQFGRTIDGREPVSLAIENNNIDVAKILINYNYPINAGSLGNSALHEAAKLGNIEITQILLDKGAKIDKNYFRKYPQDIAREHGHNLVTELIEEYVEHEV